ncbi:MAG: hypothetical protein EXR50_03340 [Dehalococcoidia bacterium]|nr:hypothetical protein [Dehalococcoidia bacterium]
MKESKKFKNKTIHRTRQMLGALLAVAVAAVLLWRPASPLVEALASTIDLRGEVPGPKLVYSEMQGDASGSTGLTTSIIWQASAHDLRKKRRLASVSHVPGYGIKASLSPNGRWVAYKALGYDSVASTTNSTLWLIDVTSQSPSHLLDAVELLGTPIWSPTGDKVAVVKTSVDVDGLGAAMAVSVDIGSGGARTLAAAQPGEWLSLVAWSADASKLYYVSTGGPGVYLSYASVSEFGASHILQKLDDFSRDFRLSPDGDTLAYTTLDRGAGPQVKTRGVSDGAARTYPDAASAVWGARDEALTFASFSKTAVLTKVKTSGRSGSRLSDPDSIGEATMPAEVYSVPKNSFHLPLAWSPDGGFIAVRDLSGGSLEGVTGERLGVADAGGMLHHVDAVGQVEFIGWLP